METVKIKVNKSSKCPLCAISLSQQMSEAIFFRTLTDDVILAGINNRLNIFIAYQDLKEHRERHIGFDVGQEAEEDEEINEIEEIDARIKAVKKRLKILDDRGEVYSNGYASLSKSLVDLVKLRNEIREGKKYNIEAKISIQDWAKQFFKEEMKANDD